MFVSKLEAILVTFISVSVKTEVFTTKRGAKIIRIFDSQNSCSQIFIKYSFLFKMIEPTVISHVYRAK